MGCWSLCEEGALPRVARGIAGLTGLAIGCLAASLSQGISGGLPTRQLEDPLPPPSCVACYGDCPVGPVDKILVNEAYTVGYSESKMNSLWVCYRVCATDALLAIRETVFWNTDLRTDALVTCNDFDGSGYQMGHMAPKAAIGYCYGESARWETFYLSNICPQTEELNNGLWKVLEAQEREWAKAFGGLWVIAGPIFDATDDALPSGVAIPDAFFKILVRTDGGTRQAIAFIMPQDSEGRTLAGCVSSIDRVQKETGLDCFSGLADAEEQPMEASIASRLWDIPPAGPGPCDCAGPDRNCDDFATPAEAQACYEHCRGLGYGDVFRLDGDGDGRVCE